MRKYTPFFSVSTEAVIYTFLVFTQHSEIYSVPPRQFVPAYAAAHLRELMYLNSCLIAWLYFMKNFRVLNMIMRNIMFNGRNISGISNHTDFYKLLV